MSMSKEMEYDDKKRTLSEKVYEGSEQYYKEQIKTGSALYSLTTLLPRTYKLLRKATIIVASYLKQKKSVQILLRFIHRTYTFLLRSPGFYSFTRFIITGFTLLTRYYLEFILYLAAIFPALLILVIFFEISET